MKPIPLNTETETVARRVIWFEPPAKALADPVRFMAYAMAYATHDDMKVIRRNRTQAPHPRGGGREARSDPAEGVGAR